MGAAGSRCIIRADSPSPKVTIVLARGKEETYSAPVSAQTVMFQHPKHLVTRPDVFRSGIVNSFVLPEAVLMPGETFYLIPFRTAEKLLVIGGEISSSRERATSSTSSHLRKITASPTISASPRLANHTVRAKRRRSPGRNWKRRGISPSPLTAEHLDCGVRPRVQRLWRSKSWTHMTMVFPGGTDVSSAEIRSGELCPGTLRRSKSWTNFTRLFPGNDTLAVDFDEEPSPIDSVSGEGYDSDTIMVNWKERIQEKLSDQINEGGELFDQKRRSKLDVSMAFSGVSSLSNACRNMLDYYPLSPGMDVKMKMKDDKKSPERQSGNQISIDDVAKSEKSSFGCDAVDEEKSRAAYYNQGCATSTRDDQESPSSMPNLESNGDGKIDKLLESGRETLQEMLARQGSNLADHQETKKIRATLGDHFSQLAPSPDYLPKVVPKTSAGRCMHQTKLYQQNLALLGFVNIQSNNPSILLQLKSHKRASRIGAFESARIFVNGQTVVDHRHACVDEYNFAAGKNPSSNMRAPSDDGSNLPAMRLTEAFISDSFDEPSVDHHSRPATKSCSATKSTEAPPLYADSPGERSIGQTCDQYYRPAKKSSSTELTKALRSMVSSGKRSIIRETPDPFLERMKLLDNPADISWTERNSGSQRPASQFPASSMPGDPNYNTTSTITSATSMSLPSYVVGPRFPMRRLRNFRFRPSRKPLSPIIEASSELLPSASSAVSSPYSSAADFSFSSQKSFRDNQNTESVKHQYSCKHDGSASALY